MPLILWHMNIGCAPKNPKVGYIWLGFMPKLIRCGVRNGRRGRAVVDMDKASEGIMPETGWEMSFSEHSSDCLTNCPVCTLCNPILVRFIAESMLTMNAIDLTKLIPVLRNVFTTLVITNGFDRASKLIFCKSLESLESSKGITFGSNRNDNPEPAEVINEGNPVMITMTGPDRKRTMHI
jgi:hypothetical protein